MHWTVLFLTAIILFHLINNLIWLFLDKTYLIYDSWYHFLLSLKVFDYLQQGFFPWLSDILGGVVYFRWHGVLVGYLTAPFYFIFGLTQDSGVMISSSIFLTILVLSTFGVGKVLFDRRVGLLAAFLVSMYPLVFNNLRVYMLDVPLTAMVVLSVYLLLKSENLTNKKYTFLFAFASGLGLLIKFNFALFILGPLAPSIYRAFKKKGFSLARRNIITAILIAVLVTFGFYRLKFWEVASRIYECSWFYAGHFYPGHSITFIVQRWVILSKDFVSFFLKDAFNNSLSPLYFILFVIGAFSKNSWKKVLFSWFFLPLFSLAFLFHYPNYNRYFMPVLQAMALISCAGVFGLKKARLRQILAAVIIVFGSLQYFNISYRADFIPEQIQIKIPFLGVKKPIPVILFKRSLSIDNRSDIDAFSYPSQADWKNDEILKEILTHSKDLKPDIKVFFMCSNVRVYEPIMYRIFRDKLPMIIDLATMSEESKYKDADIDSYKMISADFVAFINDQWRDRATPLFFKKKLDELNSLFNKNIGHFELIREFNLNNGDQLLLYKKIVKNPERISKQGLDIYFSDGITKIYHQGRQITSTIGLETSFISSGKYYSNPDFQWRSEVSAPDKLLIYATEEGLRLSMKWEIEIKNDHEISWKVSMDDSFHQKTGNLCLGLFLAGRYTEWTSSLGEKTFGLSNVHAFEEIKLPDLKPKSITLTLSKEKILPAVMFSVDNPTEEVPFVKWRSSSRVVGFYIKTKETLPKKQDIFSGTISIS
ncbi:MAG: glycosyltransferase family 39 protein [Candidatus Omnitrophica bacterium]|nr:glycosyltransferase family 39 protein [Candidatus Omnitrophota bacterium]